jgi:acyl-CoA synthetase (AMP-forming)/AMP-acid ligase II
VSGGVIPRDVMDVLHVRLPQLRLCPGWGMSESLYVTCAGPSDPVRQRNNTDGRALANCIVEIRDPDDDGRVLPAGETGQIVMKATSLMLGYYDRPDLTAQMYTPDGWFKTGDLGSLDADGCLTVRGRLKEIVLRGGENVPIVEVEILLMAHEKVKAVAVVGVPDDRLGERVCAVVVTVPTRAPLDFDEMVAYLRVCGVTPQFIPEYLVIRPEMPVTANGKIRKSDVKLVALEALGLTSGRVNPTSTT